ncbi:MAG: fumarylacetoacetate hydrolase family protein [Pseudomonadota bacterium]
MTGYLFPPRPQPSLPFEGRADRFPVARIFCVGRNYAEHAAEMGNEVDRSAPFYFTKSCHHLARSGGTVAYPPGTSDFHHEVELVVAIGAPAFLIDRGQAPSVVAGYAVGLDMTRRDLQAASKDRRRPWDMAKDVEQSAIVGALALPPGFDPNGPHDLTLTVNGVPRQSGRLSDMVWRVDEIVAHLSTLYHLAPGDLIFTGTPAGVGPVRPGDRLSGRVSGLPRVETRIG